MASAIGTLWYAQDSSSVSLMKDFYNFLPQVGKAKALQKAQINQIINNQHTNYWSPFILLGW